MPESTLSRTGATESRIGQGTPSPQVAQESLSKIQSRSARIGIIGMGYVGLPLALLFSDQKFQVTGFDIDREKVKVLSEGGSYIYRILPAEIQAARAQGFRATDDYAQVREMDVLIICVPTPLNEYREPDLSYIVGTAQAIAPHVHAGQLIVLESTTYPGTTEEVLVPILEKNPAGVKAARDGAAGAGNFYVAFSPEREDPGRTDIARPDIPKVVGGLDAIAGNLASALYNSIFRRVVRVSKPAAAEMTKLLENIYRCVNIALVNELKLLCLRMGIDIWEVIEAAKTKPFGFQAFYPGPGLGGHCIPLDPFYLSWKAKQYGFESRFIELAGVINGQMPHFVVGKVVDALNRFKKSVNGAKVLILGVAYKKNISDVRESPALDIIQLLNKKGAVLTYCDPHVPILSEHGITLEGEKFSAAALRKADCVVVVTDHDAFDWRLVARESKVVVDARNALKGKNGRKVIKL